jgi:Tfp pilus assembly protein PilX
MDMQFSGKHQKERGAALIVVILVSLTMLILAIPILTKFSGEFQVTEK